MILESFTDQEEALEGYVRLKGKGIEADLIQELDNGFLTFHLEVEESKAERARSILFDGVEFKEIEDHFLEEYTDERLLEIMMNKHEYADDLVLTATQLLKERRPDIDLAGLETHRQNEIAEITAKLKTEKRISRNQLFSYYLFSPAFGILFGFELRNKKKAPDGNSYFVYDDYSRSHALLLSLFGLLGLLIGGIAYTMARYNFIRSL